MTSQLRIGISGWTYEFWRGKFYPKGLVQKRELEYASRQMNSVEINGTFYSLQRPASYRKWHDETPDDFVFAVKGGMYLTHRRRLKDIRQPLANFFASGVLLLGQKLGPILWQFAAAKKFDAADFGAFLELLPPRLGDVTLRHVVEPRHASFLTPSFIALLRTFSIPAVYAEHATYPAIPDPVGDFVYARLQKGRDDIATGYPEEELDRWAERARAWARGGAPKGLSLLDPAKKAKYREVLELKSPGHKVFTSYIQGDDGEWTKVVTVEYKRKS